MGPIGFDGMHSDTGVNGESDTRPVVRYRVPVSRSPVTSVTNWQSGCEYKAITECGDNVGTTTANDKVVQMPKREVRPAMQYAFAA